MLEHQFVKVTVTKEDILNSFKDLYIKEFGKSDDRAYLFLGLLSVTIDNLSAMGIKVASIDIINFTIIPERVIQNC